jgi:hypothetical protein
MKKFIIVLLSAILLLPSEASLAQSSPRGFDYQAHAAMNKKAGRWGKRRMKAAKGDVTNVRCSVRSSRRAARKSRS